MRSDAFLKQFIANTFLTPADPVFLRYYLLHNDGGSFSVVTNAGAIITDAGEDQSPSGIVQELSNVALRQFIEVIEPARLKALGIEMNQFRFQTEGFEGSGWIDVSHDFIKWEPLTNVNSSAALRTFVFPASDSSATFYRVRNSAPSARTIPKLP